jgi:hypothetical protein
MTSSTVVDTSIGAARVNRVLSPEVSMSPVWQVGLGGQAPGAEQVGQPGKLTGTMPASLSDASAAALRRLTERLAPDALTLLRDIRTLISELENDPATLQSVRDALADGASWDQIADAAGLKPAAAKWRWQGTDAEIAARAEAGRRRSARPSSVPTDLPGYSVADAAKKLGVTPQAVYLAISRGKLTAQTVELADGRTYKRVLLDE